MNDHRTQHDIKIQIIELAEQIRELRDKLICTECGYEAVYCFLEKSAYTGLNDKNITTLCNQCMKEYDLGTKRVENECNLCWFDEIS